MIKYLDRYSDGYVELAEALLDPVKKQKYLSSGLSYEYYIDSNLENFLIITITKFLLRQLGVKME